jgi:hypothetical protein
MKKIIFILLLFVVAFSMESYSQLPSLPFSLKQKVEKFGYVFEGRVLSNDSTFFDDYLVNPWTAQKIVIIKQFKGELNVDTIEVVTRAEKKLYNNDYWIYGKSGVLIDTNYEGVFFASFISKTYSWNVHIPNAYYIEDTMNTCGKVDVIKEVYEPIEKLTGKKYVEVHPKECKGN